MQHRMALLLLPLAALAGCGPQATLPPSRSAASRPPPPPAEAGLARVMGKDARALAALLGKADLDQREGHARKLQYRGSACVLDAYLYPPATGGEPRVTWIDARTARGDDMDRASCIAALVRR